MGCHGFATRRVATAASPLGAVGAPACHDFTFVNYYCHRFVGRNPLGYACLDLLSLAMGRLSAKGYSDLEYRIERRSRLAT